MVVMVGFNLFFSPLVPRPMRWPHRKSKLPRTGGRVCVVVGSIAFVIGSALTGKLVSLYDYRATSGATDARRRLDVAGYVVTSCCAAARGKPSAGERRLARLGVRWWHKVGVFSPASVCCKGRTPPTTVLAPSTGRAGCLSTVAVGYLWSLRRGEVIIFLSKKAISAGLAPATLLLLAVCGVVRWGLMAGVRRCRG